MRHTVALTALLLSLLAACDRVVDQPTSTDTNATAAITQASAITQADKPADDIAWRKGDVTAAFAEAAETGKPVLLYWGAEWCPPCHRLRAGLFKEPDFIARTRDFVPVYLDGDTEGAQRWGDHFQIQGYPTIILLTPDQAEITRLSGSEEPDEIAGALRAAHENQVSAAELFTRARSAPEQLTSNEWTLLAAYGWDVDVTALVPAEERVTLFNTLAEAAPDAALQRRFALLALANEADNDAPAYAPERQAEIRAMLSTLLVNADEVKRSRWPLMYSGAAIIERAGGTPDERAALETGLVIALDRQFNDASLPLVDRVLLIRAELDIHRLNAGNDAPPAPPVLEKVRQRAAWADAMAQTPAERQSAIYYAAGLLIRAGDLDSAERLLNAELARSATPYYYMPDLADIAEQRGDKAKAIEWYRKGYETSSGPATRVQWGLMYVDALIRLAPKDAASIEQASSLIIGELADADSYHQRTRVRFDALGETLDAWGKGDTGAQAVVARLRTRMHEICVPAQSDA
ncbi:MAG: thioredoxin family protein, partial [Pseudomonadota bacterium]|nr:thioredoxin family protein [Pseudomonadota bacterium]